MAARRKQFPTAATPSPARNVLKLFAASIGIAALFSCCQNPRKEGAANVRMPPMPQSAPPQYVARPEIQTAASTPRQLEPHVASPRIRVAALKDAPSVRISSGPAGARVLTETHAEITRLPAGAVIQIACSPAGLSVDGGAQAFNALRIESLSPEADLHLNEQELAPSIQLVRSAKGSLTAIAHIDLENYLCGVLAGEVPFNKWHSEALKAQAVTSRSYAYHQIQQHAGEAYDVEATIMSQVFKPGFRTNPILMAAVNATRALVLTERGETFSAYFHSTCGGNTETSVNVFPDHPATRALSGAQCGYCTQSPHYRWKWLLNKAALEQKLRANQPSQNIGKIQSVEFVDAGNRRIGDSNSGRVAQVRIQHSGGQVQMQGNQFRLMVSPRDLKSLLFERVIDRGDALDITGGGFGHGTGMCQFGSQGMAVAGANYAQILGRYFPGAALTKMY